MNVWSIEQQVPGGEGSKGEGLTIGVGLRGGSALSLHPTASSQASVNRRLRRSGRAGRFDLTAARSRVIPFYPDTADATRLRIEISRSRR